MAFDSVHKYSMLLEEWNGDPIFHQLEPHRHTLTDFDCGLNRLPLLAPAPLGTLRRHWGQKHPSRLSLLKWVAYSCRSAASGATVNAGRAERNAAPRTALARTTGIAMKTAGSRGVKSNNICCR